MSFFRKNLALSIVLGVIILGAVACGGDGEEEAPGASEPSQSLTLYSGRTEALIQPLLDQFEKDTGIDVKVKYGDTAELAALLNEEGSKSPADIYLAQDAGALGAVAATGLLDKLAESTLSKVDATYRSSKGEWVGVSGRARVVVYNTDQVHPTELPASVKNLTDERWKGKVGWAPTNGSFQAFVTAFRQIEGEDAAKRWLEEMKANGAKEYKDNKAIVSAVASGEIQLGLVNHYYLYGFLQEQGEGFKARNHYTVAKDVGSLVNVAGVGILKSSKRKDAATKLVDYLLSERAQRHFAEQTYEYPVIAGVSSDPRLKPLKEIDPPNLDLSKLEDLKGTLALLRSTSVLP